MVDLKELMEYQADAVNSFFIGSADPVPARRGSGGCNRPGARTERRVECCDVVLGGDPLSTSPHRKR